MNFLISVAILDIEYFLNRMTKKYSLDFPCKRVIKTKQLYIVNKR